MKHKSYKSTKIIGMLNSIIGMPVKFNDVYTVHDYFHIKLEPDRSSGSGRSGTGSCEIGRYWFRSGRFSQCQTSTATIVIIRNVISNWHSHL